MFCSLGKFLEGTSKVVDLSPAQERQHIDGKKAVCSNLYDFFSLKCQWQIRKY